MFGKTCSMVMRKAPFPEARAASTNSRAQIALAEPRVSRVKVGIWKMPIAMIERLMLGLRSDLLLIPCRSARLNWPTVETILRKRPLPHAIDHATLEIAQRDYRRLSLETAQRTVRFWQLHKRIEKQPMAAG